MTGVRRTRIVFPLQGRRTSEHDRDPATLRFSQTYANVKQSGIANTNERLGADSANRVATPDSPTSRFLREGVAE